MQIRVLGAMLIFALVVPGTLFAQRSMSGNGRYATYTLASDTTELPDGRMVAVSHYKQHGFASTAGHPLDNQAADCVGMFVLNADATPITASGTCFGRDSEGDGVSFWWRLDAAATADCPIMCGSFGYFAGYGKFEGIRGEGTWKASVLHPDGNMGTWQGTHSMRR